MQLTIKKFNEETLQIEDCGVSIKWNNDNEQYKSLNDWIKEVTPKVTNPIKRFSNRNAIDVNGDIKQFDNVSIGKFLNNANGCQYNQSHVSIFSNEFSGNAQYFIYSENLDRIILSYSVRLLIKQNWLNDKDEYRVPSKQNGLSK